ncbi:MAG: cytochrome P450 [Acidimicrobiaceae bacterium]|nr:cytochrome P450 [Acidimicrobiaceae bacterium]MYC43688.1 cytochrome P450 [Acidimicrobiaceae bacterium]
MARSPEITLAELETDPDPILAGLRATDPVSWSAPMEMWLVTRWDDVMEMEAHPELFSAATDPSFLARALGPNMLTTDPPEHTRVQAMMQPPFRSGGRSGEFVKTELVPLADLFLDQVDPVGFDLMASYAQPLSAASLSIVLGLSDLDSEEDGFKTMWRWCEGLCADIANFENDPELTELGKRTKAELGEAITNRLATAGDDGSAISYFARRGATHDEIVNNVRLMISGGINEPRDGIGLVGWVLLSRPDLRAVVENDSARMRRLIEEVFRVYSPVGTITRQATRDLELAGVAIKAGDLVSGVLRSINLCETHWTNPTEIDLDRREGEHAAFALGTHRCLGEWLGRQVVRVGVQRLLERFPDLRLDPNHRVELRGFEFRGPLSVHVLTS